MTVAFGAAIRLTNQVKVGGVLTTPASISMTVLLPDNTTDGPFTPVSDGVGLYHYDYISAQAGQHVARWVTTSPVGAKEETFDVAPMWGEAGVVSLAEAKAQLNIDAENTEDDAEIQGFIRSVTAICERYAGSLTRTIHVETHTGGYGMALAHPPILSLTSVTAIQQGSTDQAVGDLALDATNGIVRRLDRGRMVGPFTVTYVAGRTSIPPNVRQAALIILQHMWETQRGGMPARFGNQDEVYDSRITYSIPRRAQELLGDQPTGIA
ncbi:MAG: phage gp6-like head-tail connector protein [Streptomyces sp.]|nr:phage gp6-like head-tail connector protein [Streptomyces sp.]